LKYISGRLANILFYRTESGVYFNMGGNAAGMVLRLALKTRFSVMGMGFDSSAARHIL